MFGENLASQYKTWFVPPKTGKYRFYAVCDDRCELNIAQCPGSIEPMTRLLKLNYWTKYNGFWSNENRYGSGGPRKVSDWIELTEGEHYHMTAKYLEGVGGDYFRTGVEIENSGIVGHHQTMKQI